MFEFVKYFLFVMVKSNDKKGMKHHKAAGMRETGCALQGFSSSFSLVLAPS
jgi:hypothetical protein